MLSKTMLSKLNLLTALTTLIRQALLELQFNVPTMGDTQAVYSTYIVANHPGESTLIPKTFDGIPKGKLTDKIEELYANKMQAIPEAWAPASAPATPENSTAVVDNAEPVVEDTSSPQGEAPQQSPETAVVEDEDNESPTESPVEAVPEENTETLVADPAPKYYGFLYNGEDVVDAETGEKIGSGEYTFKLFVESVDTSAEPTLNELSQEQIDALVAAGLNFTATTGDDVVVEVSQNDNATATIELEAGENVESTLVIRVSINHYDENGNQDGVELLVAESFDIQS